MIIFEPESQAKRLDDYLKESPPSHRMNPEVWKKFNVGLVMFVRQPEGHYKLTCLHCDDDTSIEHGKVYD